MNLWPVVAAAVLVFTLVSATPVQQLSIPGAYRPIQPQQKLRRQNAIKIHNQAPLRDYSPQQAKPKDVKLVNYRNKLYHGPITVGTPGQQFSVTFDTATHTMWLPSVHSPPDKNAFHSPQRYNNASSSTYRTNGEAFTVDYDLSEVKGYLSQDSVTVGGFTLKNQVFGEAILESNRFANHTLHDGIIGLGLSNSAENEHPTVFENMISQRVLPAPVFSFYFNRYNTDDRDSVLTLGGTNAEYYTGEFTFADVIAPHAWNFWVDGVQLPNRYGIYSKRRCQAVVDSVSTFIVGPKDVTDVLNKKLGGETLLAWPKLHQIDCETVDSLPDVEFIVNGEVLSLSSQYYVIRITGNRLDYCYSAIVGRDMDDLDTPVWSLGLPFMRAFYTQFDKGNNRVGFAKANH